MSRTAHLTLVGSPGTEDDDLLRLATQLSRQLADLDVLDVREARRSGDSWPGAKSGGDLAAGTLAVTAGGFVLRQAFVLADTWLRNRPLRSIRVELEGKTLELGHASAAERERLIDLFLTGDSTTDSQPNEPDSPSHEQPHSSSATA
ncbi:hypothetical protein ACIP3D_19350 [Streptomyces longwoodensis]|uniref:hypothetical protein n=1 Tax=Streptomyces longwoodensis TaxID=68231 RepID=UPI003804C388